MPLERLVVPGLLEGTQCVVLQPKGIAATCSAGLGKLLDYALASPIIPWISGKIRAVACPWKVHLGLAIDIRDVPEVKIRVPIAPKDFAALPALAKAARARLVEELGRKVTWHGAVQLAHDYLAQSPVHPPPGIKDPLAFKVMAEDTTEHAERYGLWVTAAKVYLAINYASAEGERPVIGQYLGRANSPRFGYSKLTDVRRVTNMWADKDTQALSVIITLLTFATALLRGHAGHQQIARALASISASVGTFPKTGGRTPRNNSRRMKPCRPWHHATSLA